MTTVTLHTAVMCLFPDEYKSELGQQLSLIAGSLVGGVCIVSLIAIAIICARYGHTEANWDTCRCIVYWFCIVLLP